MKLKSLFVFLTVCFMVSVASAADWSDGVYWDSNTANWTADYWVTPVEGPPSGTAASWDLAHLKTNQPDGSKETIIGRNLHAGIVSGGNVTVDGSTSIEWTTAGFAAATGQRMRVAGNATLNILAGGQLIGPGWIRVGEKSMPNKIATEYAPDNFADGAATINQSGGLFGLLAGGHDTTKLVISDGGLTASVDSDGLYYMTGGTLTSYGSGEGGTTANDDIGQITLGDRNGSGKFIIEGTAPVIEMGELYVGGATATLQGTVYRAATGTLEYRLTAGGVSSMVLIPKTVESDGATWDPGVIQPIVALDQAGTGTARLLVSLIAEELDDSYAPIVLVDNTGTRAVWGDFDTINGIDGSEGAVISLGGELYALTYVYDADDDDMNNDIALVWVPEPATIALLSLGLIAIRRKK